MALVNKINQKSGIIQQQDTDIPMDITIGSYEGNTAVRLGSKGSDNRKTKKKTSQVYVLEEDSAKQLYDILKSTFNF